MAVGVSHYTKLWVIRHTIICLYLCSNLATQLEKGLHGLQNTLLQGSLDGTVQNY